MTSDQGSGSRWLLDRGQLLRRGAAGALGLSVLGVAACGDDDDNGGATNPSGAATTPTGPPTGLLKLGFIGLQTKPINDPDNGSPGFGTVALLWNVFERLAITHDGEIQLRAAESIESSDAINWDITLNEGMTFHDGKPVRPEDVIWTFRRRSKPPAAGAATFSAITAMEKTGPRSLRVTLNGPDATFVQKFGGNSDILPVGFDADNPIGSGPYKFVSQDSVKTVLEANESWWASEKFGGPHIKTIEIYYFKDETARVNALLAGQIDAIEGFSLGQLPQLEGNANLAVVIAASETFTPFVMNAAVDPFKDVRVRQAMRLLVDRKGMNEQVLRGKGTIGKDVFMPFDPGSVVDELPEREQDVEQVKSLLSAAGQSDLSLTLNTGEITTGAMEMSQVIVEQAKSAGVTIKLKQIDPAQYFTPEAGYGSYPFSVSIGAGAVGYLSYVSIVYGPNAFYAETNWNDEEYLAIYAEAIKTVDDAKRSEMVGELQRIDYERGAYIIWGFNPTLTASSSKLQGVKPIKAQTGLNDFRFEQLFIKS